MQSEILIGIILIFSFISTYFVKRIAQKYQIVDIPNQRSSHNEITPRGGGLAIVISWFLGISVLFYLGQIESHLYYALMCGTVLAVISLLDDIINLSPKIRLLTQVLVAVGALMFLKGINPIFHIGYKQELKYILYPITIIGIVWFINLYNFLDGIDAYISIETIFLALCFYLFTGNLIALILIVSVIGFLYWNWPKAKIFMGDVGSTQLGFIIVVLGIYFHNENELSILNWILLTSPFWFDATFTLYRRWRNKEKLSIAHKKHAYQRIVQAGFTHLKTDIYLIVINIILLVSVFIVRRFEFLYFLVLLMVLAILYILTRQIDKRKSF
ncbi:MAG: glycosyltransferase family 4 protein [Bacteroidales bacterium]|nr:glycosyltransferase family 4 protein [Bacteroidales bacterium]